MWDIISKCGMLRKTFQRALQAQYRAGRALDRRESEENTEKYESAKKIADEYRTWNREMLKQLNPLLPETFKKLREIVVVHEDIEDWEQAEAEWVAVESDARAAFVAQPDKPTAPQEQPSSKRVDGGTPEQVKKPSHNAIACYRVHITLGQPSQDQTAQTLAKEWGKVVHQGTVSRWVREVDAWLKAGHVLPEIELADNRSKPKAVPVDPSRLDLGRRTDHKRPHRRAPLQE